MRRVRRPSSACLQVLRHNVDENFAQVAPFVGDLVDRATFDDVRAFQLGALAAHADRFVARVGRMTEAGVAYSQPMDANRPPRLGIDSVVTESTTAGLTSSKPIFLTTQAISPPTNHKRPIHQTN